MQQVAAELREARDAVANLIDAEHDLERCRAAVQKAIAGVAGYVDTGAVAFAGMYWKEAKARRDAALARISP